MSAWQLFPHGLVFHPGFPSCKITDVWSTGSENAIDAYVEASGRRADTKALATMAVADATNLDKRVRRKLMSALQLSGTMAIDPELAPHLEGTVARQPLLRYFAQSAELEQLRCQAQEAVAEHYRSCEAALWDVCLAPEFAEAIFLTNPSISQRFLYERRTRRECMGESRSRKLAVRLYSYLQRGCLKTHVGGGLGRVGFMEFDARGRGFLLDPVEESHEIFVSYWAVEAMAQRLISLPAVLNSVAPTLSPMLRIEKGSGEIRNELTGECLRLSEEERLVLAEIDGHRTIGELCSKTALSREELTSRLERLRRRGIAVVRLAIPATSFHPLRSLRQQLAASLLHCSPAEANEVEKWIRSIDALDATRCRMKRGDAQEQQALLDAFDQQFKSISGCRARRNAGSTYGDRLPFYEERSTNVRGQGISATLRQEIEQRCSPALDLCLAYGVVLKLRYLGFVTQVLDELGAESTSFLNCVRVLQEMARKGLLIDSDEPRLFERRWERIIRDKARQPGSEIKLERPDLEQLGVYRLLEGVEGHATIDLFLDAASVEQIREGRYRPVIGELHENVMPWGSQLWFHPNRGEVERACNDWFATRLQYGSRMAMIVPPRLHKGMLNEAFGGIFVLADAAVARDSGTIPLSELRVERRPGHLPVLTHDSAPLTFFHHHDELVHLWAFAPPRVLIPRVPDFNGHSPRLNVEGAILQRAQWSFGLDALDTSDLTATMIALRAAQRGTEIPDRVFAHFCDEPKPFAVNIRSPICVELIRRYLRRSGGVRFTEMLPDISGAWLAGDQGSHVVESRLLMSRALAPEARPAVGA